MFAEARRSESETSGSSGISGEQTGVELRASRWYQASETWAKVYRFRDPAVRERIARAAELIVLNGWFGYDQNDRGEAESALIKVGRNISAVHTPCEVDCSMLVFEAVKTVTGVGYDKASDDQYFAHGNDYPKTWNMDAYLERCLPMAGFALDVYTLTNWADDTATDKVLRADVSISDATGSANQWGYYETPYDTISASMEASVSTFDSKYNVTKTKTYTKTYDLATLQANLSVSVANSNSVWMESAANLVRGDIVRARVDYNSSHIAVWI